MTKISIENIDLEMKFLDNRPFLEG